MKYAKLYLLQIFAFLFLVQNSFAQLSGTYTINKSIGTGAGNFNSFNDAAQALDSQGVSGPVIFNVTSNSGPYNERLKIDTIIGASSVNNITFNCKGNTIQSAPPSTELYIIQLNGARYVTFDSLIIYDTSDSYGWGFHLKNGSHYNTIQNCIIDLTNVGNDNYASSGIVGSSSDNNQYALGDNASFCVFKNNLIKGAQNGGMLNGIILNGDTGSLASESNQIINNKIEDFYANGIEIHHSINAFISKNEIHRENKSNITEFKGILANGVGNNLVIEKNIIHDSHTSNPSSTLGTYGIYVYVNCSVLNPVHVRNNLIYNMNGSSFIKGISVTANYAFVAHNTVSIGEHTIFSLGIKEGLIATQSTSNVTFKNNIVSITRKGGAGRGIVLPFASTAISDHNDFYINTASSDCIGRLSSTNYYSLSSWKMVNSGAYDQNSTDADPRFNQPDYGLFIPTSYLVDSIGTPLPSVADDISGTTRNTVKPDPGAYEFDAPRNDAGITSIYDSVFPCPGTYPLSVKLKNFGLDNLDSCRIHWRINGVLQPTYYFTNTLVINVDTQLFVGNYYVTDGSMHDIEAWTSHPNGFIDDNPYNDSLLKFDVESAMSGYYTVGSTGDFSSLIAAAENLNRRGVCGPVTIEMDSAIYTGQVLFNKIVGASSVNKVTIKGNYSTVIATPDDTSRHIIKLNKSRYLILDSIIVKTTSNDYGYGFYLYNASNNVIKNCIVSFGNVNGYSGPTDWENAMGIYSWGGQGYLGTDEGGGKYNEVLNNVIEGGPNGGPYWGIRFRGDDIGSIIDGNIGNKVIGNKVMGFYIYGIHFSYGDSNLIDSNELTRPVTSRTLSNTYGIYLFFNNTNTIIRNNSIHNLYGGNPTFKYLTRCIYLAGTRNYPGDENYIYNNMIYDIQYGSVVAFKLSGASNCKIYHNTVELTNNHVLQSSRTTMLEYSYQFSIPGNNEFKNNILYLKTTGLGEKFIYDITTYRNVEIDYNNVFIANSDSNSFISRSPSNHLEYMKQWKRVNNNAYDQHSDSLDPIFLNPLLSDYTPNSPSMNNKGDSIGITIDIFGFTRDINHPDIGAIEYGPFPYNDTCLSADTVYAGITRGYTTGATLNGNPLSCGTSIDSSGGTWYKYYGKGQFVKASLCGSKFDTKLSVYTGICDSLVCLNGNDDSCNTSSQVGWCALPNFIYYLFIHGKNNEQGEFKLNISEFDLDSAEISLFPDSIACIGDTVTLSSNNQTSYLWSDINQSTSHSIQVLDSGIYILETIDSLGCITNDSKKVRFKECEEQGIGDELIDAKIKIYPNPTNGTFSLDLSELKNSEFQIEIYNASGEIILNKKVSYGSTNYEIELQRIPGFYLVHIYHSEFDINRKLIVK